MPKSSSVLVALCVCATLGAQSVAELPAPVLATSFLDMDLLPPGPVTLAQVNAIASPSGGSISNLTATPSGAPAGIYNTATENGLAWQSGQLAIVDLNAAFDPVNARIDLVGASSEIGFGIGDWVGPMVLYFYFGGNYVTSYTTSNYSSPIPKIFKMTGGLFDRVDVRASSSSGNWTFGDFYIEPTVPTGTVLATATNYGTGCGNLPDVSFYEMFSAGAFDLVAPVDNMTLIRGGSSYLGMTGLASFVPPSPAATALALGDDAEVQVTLSAPFPYGIASSTASLTVCSNGFVSTGSNGTSYTPDVVTMLGNPNAGWYSWHDYNPTAGGTVWFEEAGGVAYVTWDNVPSYGQTVGEELQFQFDLTTGDVAIVWQSISNLGGSYLVGFSAGGPSADPGPIDLSAMLPNLVPNIGSVEIEPIALDTSPRPIINTTVDLSVSNMAPSTIFGAVTFGINQPPAPIDLTPIGMAGCYQYTNQLFNLLFFPAGANSASVQFAIPNRLNLNIYAQGFSYDPGSGLTTLGALASNATHLMTGDW